jgi:hypothetical protein
MGIGFPLSLLPSTAVSRLCSEWCHLRKPSAPEKTLPLSLGGCLTSKGDPAKQLQSLS